MFLKAAKGRAVTLTGHMKTLCKRKECGGEKGLIFLNKIVLYKFIK